MFLGGLCVVVTQRKPLTWDSDQFATALVVEHSSIGLNDLNVHGSPRILPRASQPFSPAENRRAGGTSDPAQTHDTPHQVGRVPSTGCGAVLDAPPLSLLS